MIKLEIQGQRIALSYPNDLEDRLRPFFSQFDSCQTAETEEILHLRAAGSDTFKIEYCGHLLWEGLTWPGLLTVLCGELEHLVAVRMRDAAVRAAAVRGSNRSVLILGPAGCGKTELALWFIRQGFTYLADNFVSLATQHSNLRDERNAISPLPLPLAPHFSADLEPSGLAPFEGMATLDVGDVTFVMPERLNGPRTIEHCGLVIVPRFYEASRLEVEVVKPVELQFLLGQALHPAQRLTPYAVERIARFAQAVPAIVVRYGDQEQLDGTLDRLVHAVLADKVEVTGLPIYLGGWTWQPAATRAPTVSGTQAQAQPEPISIPQPASPTVKPAGARKRLTIGMATFDDFDGAYFTLQALRLYHPEVAGEVEFILVDNNPDGVCGPSLKALEQSIPNCRYIPLRERSGTAVRDYVMSEASSEFVLNVDCHVLVVPGAVSRLIHYFEAHPQTADLLQGPLVYDNLTALSTHMEPKWNQGMLGVWGLDERGKAPDAPPFEIPMQGLGLYACRRSVWPGYNANFRGFGGEEGYIHEKFRQAGGRTLCLPFLRWLHRFHRPFGVPYKISWEDRVRNYLFGMDELGLPVEPVFDHFRQFLGPDAETLIAEAQRALLALKQQTL
ncbi:hypothetical protein GCM10007874_69190 [Labrys miyagiensis]|uniref:Glycosyltransferase 2-like domain-containing protein n=1 Tax=Labrys miyagiensis TaxID=346912 RepID=A0ABQ6CU59_9HYPH|nr:glycosyltransferase [Labrys miyagiensis]GLS23898.1 hypothetical protein GCM10007874_69190 [Labrys miyagiensis]